MSDEKWPRFCLHCGARFWLLRSFLKLEQHYLGLRAAARALRFVLWNWIVGLVILPCSLQLTPLLQNPCGHNEAKLRKMCFKGPQQTKRINVQQIVQIFALSGLHAWKLKWPRFGHKSNEPYHFYDNKALTFAFRRGLQSAEFAKFKDLTSLKKLWNIPLCNFSHFATFSGVK